MNWEKVSDILSLQKGVFFYYSIFSVSKSVGYLMLINCIRYFSKIKQKERYLTAMYSPIREVEEMSVNLGMRTVTNTVAVHKLYEIEVDALTRYVGYFGTVKWMAEKFDRKAETENLTGEAKWEGLSEIAAQKPNNVSRPVKKYLQRKICGYSPLMVDKMRNEACPNPKCTLYGKTKKGNVVSNGAYRISGGTSVRRFLCKECGKSFCSRAGSIFYGLRSPVQKVLMALKLLVEGRSLRGVAEALEVKFDTVRRWLKVAAQNSKEIDAILAEKMNVSQIELDALWTFVKRNSLRQRAILGKGRRLICTN